MVILLKLLLMYGRFKHVPSIKVMYVTRRLKGTVSHRIKIVKNVL